MATLRNEIINSICKTKSGHVVYMWYKMRLYKNALAFYIKYMNTNDESVRKSLHLCKWNLYPRVFYSSGFNFLGSSSARLDFCDSGKYLCKVTGVGSRLSLLKAAWLRVRGIQYQHCPLFSWAYWRTKCQVYHINLNPTDWGPFTSQRYTFCYISQALHSIAPIFNKVANHFGHYDFI